jgi:DNA end-binding protein Ku
MMMSMRAIWKGVIRFGGVYVPVKLYSAVTDQKVHFRLLHDRDHEPVEQQMVDPRTNKPVPKDQIRRGLETESGEIVMITDEELASIVPEASREIEITRFVDQDRISYQYYDRPYFLGPDGDEENYFSLAKALEKEKKQGVARWTMRKKRYVGSLHAGSGYLELFTFRFAGEIVSLSDIPRPPGRKFEPMELRMAEQLIDALANDFDPSAYENEYRQRVIDLIDTKARGDVYMFEKDTKQRPKPTSLANTLEQSLRRIKEEKIA